MPLATAPNIIEQSEFSVGWCPDLERSNVPPNGLIDSQNLVPDKVTGALQTRHGYKRIAFAEAGYTIRSIHPYSRITSDAEEQFLIIVGTNGVEGAADNIKIWVYNLQADNYRRVDVAGKVWADATGRHFGETVSQIFYGGGKDEFMYSIYPRSDTNQVAAAYAPGSAYTVGTAVTFGGSTWVAAQDIPVAAAYNAATNYSVGNVVTSGGKRWKAKRETVGVTPSTTGAGAKKWQDADPNLKTLEWNMEFNPDATSAVYPTYTKTNGALAQTAPASTVVRSDKAFKYRERVSYEGQNYSAAVALDEFDNWEVDKVYEPGEKVIHTGGVTPTDDAYFRAFQVRNAKAHKASTSNEPGTAGGDDYWRLVTLDAPINKDGDRSEDWDLVPKAPKTNIAAWFGNRLFMKYEDDKGLGRTLFSSQPDFYQDRTSDITRTRWDPTDWAVTGDAGAGWQDFQTGDGDEVHAYFPFGFYLLVFKRRSVHVIAGTNPATWQVRQLAPVGAISPTAICEFDGLVYFLGDRGLFVTDGSQVQEVGGFNKVRDWFKESLDWDSDEDDPPTCMWAHDGYIWISVPTEINKVGNRCIVYDPDTESFWKQTLSVNDVAIARIKGVDQLFFAPETKTGDAAAATTAWLGTPHRSKSTLTFPGHSLHTNNFTNPSFEASSSSVLKFSELQANISGWTRTSSTKVQFAVTSAAKRRGNVGAEVTNKESANNWHGIYQTVSDTNTNDHHIACYVRLPRRSKERKLNAKDFRFDIGGTMLPEVDHTFTDVGRGWYRVMAMYTGSLTARAHGFRIKPGLTVQVDQFMATEHIMGQEHEYFDGSALEGASFAVVGGGTGLVMQYNSPAAVKEETLEDGTVVQYAVDDGGDAVYAPADIDWMAQTSWFPFGVMREERRIRRIWTLIRGPRVTAAIRTLRNYANVPTSALTSEAVLSDAITERVTDHREPATYVEGRTTPDCHAIGFVVEGLRAPAAILGVAAETQPRRIRFHS